jgi:hypothetical protein
MVTNKPNDKILCNLEVHTFGQPRIRDPIFAQNNDQLLKDPYYHVVDEKDPVPRQMIMSLNTSISEHASIITMVRER